MGLILSQVDWEGLSRQVEKETKNREVYQPLVSLYRWWARRPHSLVGALLDAAGKVIPPDIIVADPFSGGGTVAIESARRRYRVYAQDLHPWSAWGLKVSLTPISSRDLRGAAATFLSLLKKKSKSLYQSRCDMHGDGTIANTFRVRTVPCAHCKKKIWLYPYSLITVASRAEKEKWGYFGCKKCGAVSRRGLKSENRRCGPCGSILQPPEKPLFPSNNPPCPHCKETIAQRRGHAQRWSIVLVQRICGSKKNPIVHFDSPTTKDTAAARQNLTTRIPKALKRSIPLGQETTRLRTSGFKKWADLYPGRQLKVILTGFDVLKKMKLSRELKNRLAVALVGAVEMAGYLCRWDRFHPKIFEALSNHRYSATGVAVESNILASVGRGSLERRLYSSVAAARWTKSHLDRQRNVSFNTSRMGARYQPAGSGVSVVQGSSENLYLPDRSVRLIVTDPPYYDSIQYSELAELFLTWMRASGLFKSGLRLRASAEAVPNRSRGTTPEDYERILSSIFAESSRILTTDGRLILTFHSTKLRAWAALGKALASSGLKVRALAVARAENRGDHCKRSNRAFITDLLIECFPSKRSSKPKIFSLPKYPEERELLYVGQAMAEGGASGYAEVRRLFLEKSARMRDRRIETPVQLEN